LQTLPFEVVCCPKPYTEEMTWEDKFNALYDSLERTRRLGSRILQLSMAFYLEQFLEVEVSAAMRTHYVQKLSYHYRITVTRVYYLFKLAGPNQLMRMKYTSLTLIRRLSLQEYQALLTRSFEIFNRG
jgi:hypothetical protein